ncbi:MAG TPA: hypothetical protein VND44_02600 [Acidimicrobiales bacterium]|nr:hypothetical protein [Acidimicrobiales bacterium]
MSDLGDSFDLELAAAQLRADSADVRILLKALVDQLADALGTRLQAKRAGGRFRKSDDVTSVSIAMGDDQFDAEVDGDVLRCTVGHTSGGIRIRTERVEMNAWLSRLLAGLKAEADHSQAVRLALEHMVIGGDG